MMVQQERKDLRMLNNGKIYCEKDLVGHLIYYKGRVFCHMVNEWLEYNYTTNHWEKRAVISTNYWNGQHSWGAPFVFFCKYRQYILFKDADLGNICALNIDTNKIRELYEVGVQPMNGFGGLVTIEKDGLLHIFPSSNDGKLLIIDENLNKRVESKDWICHISSSLKSKGFEFDGFRAKCVSSYGEYLYFVAKTDRKDLVIEVDYKKLSFIRIIEIAEEGRFRGILAVQNGIWLFDDSRSDVARILYVDFTKNFSCQICEEVPSDKRIAFFGENKDSVKWYWYQEGDAIFQDLNTEESGVLTIYLSGNDARIINEQSEVEKMLILDQSLLPLNAFLSVVRGL